MFNKCRPLLLFQGGRVAKNLPANAGDARDAGLIPGTGRSPGIGNGNPLQYSCLENPMNRGAWRATVYSVTGSDTTEHTRTNMIINSIEVPSLF